MATRLLFLDDSGKPAANDGTMAVVIGGFSIASEDVPVLSRRIVGAKTRFYPSRGNPTDWEAKSTDTISRNTWRRRKNRDFIDELTRILGRLSCTSYTAALRKANMLHPMTLKTTVPPQLQARVAERDGRRERLPHPCVAHIHESDRPVLRDAKQLRRPVPSPTVGFAEWSG